jgi:pilus assembly protein Flp/PilA
VAVNHAVIVVAAGSTRAAHMHRIFIPNSRQRGLKMNKAFNAIKQSIFSFAKEEDGAQVVEYALIIAVISIALVIALRALTEGAAFTSFIARVASCLTSSICV